METHQLSSRPNLISSWTFCGFGILFLLLDSFSKFILQEGVFLYVMSIILYAAPKVLLLAILMLATRLLDAVPGILF